MKMEIATLEYPKKSHRKTISIPSESIELAELMGIALGDGGINNDWQLVITLNSISDLEYSQYVKNLLERLFAIHIAVRLRKDKNAMVLVCSSTSLVDFLITKGSVRGNKIKQKITTPLWIQKMDMYERYFVRGLMDTDGGLYIHKHTVNKITYQNIGLCFGSASFPLICSVAAIFQKFGIKPHISKDKRKIYLYSEKAVVDYLRIFGSSNPRITNKFNEWKGA